MSVSNVSTIFGLVSPIIQTRLGRCDIYSKHLPPLQTKIEGIAWLLFLKMTINGKSMIIVLVSRISIVRCNDIKLDVMNRPPLWAVIVFTILLPPPKYQHQQSVNTYLSSIFDSQRALQPVQPISKVSAIVIGKYATHDISTVSGQWVSTPQQQFLVFQCGYTECYCIA